MPENRTDIPEPATGTGWPGGWYIYENGRVAGPYTAEDAFKLDAETADGKPRLVSRKGFTQWYALKDLSEIFKITDQLGRKAVQQIGDMESQLAAARELALRQSVTQAPAPEAEKVLRQEVPEVQAPTPAPTAAIPQAPAHKMPPAGVPEVKKPLKAKASESLAKPVAPRESVVSAPKPATAARQAQVTAKPSVIKRSPKAQLMQEYFLARGRLRLGKLRNPWISAFFGIPLSLGVSWVLWVRDLGREVTFHARNSDKTGLPPAIFAAVPLVHMFVIYRLAKLVVEMEAQNKYRSVSPLVAALFAVFPPFAMAYLQDAVNRHWLLHVKHVIVKKRASGE